MIDDICHIFKPLRLPVFKFKINYNKKRKTNILCHGLLRSKIFIKNQFGDLKNILYNRDLNASLNIKLLAEYSLQGKPRPDYLSRDE